MAYQPTSPHDHPNNHQNNGHYQYLPNRDDEPYAPVAHNPNQGAYPSHAPTASSAQPSHAAYSSYNPPSYNQNYGTIICIFSH